MHKNSNEKWSTHTKLHSELELGSQLLTKPSRGGFTAKEIETSQEAKVCRQAG